MVFCSVFYSYMLRVCECVFCSIAFVFAFLWCNNWMACRFWDSPFCPVTCRVCFTKTITMIINVGSLPYPLPVLVFLPCVNLLWTVAYTLWHVRNSTSLYALPECGAPTYLLPCFLFVHVVLLVSHVCVVSPSLARGGGGALAPTQPCATRTTFSHQSQVALYLLKTCTDIHLFGVRRQGSRSAQLLKTTWRRTLWEIKTWRHTFWTRKNLMAHFTGRNLTGFEDKKTW